MAERVIREFIKKNADVGSGIFPDHFYPSGTFPIGTEGIYTDMFSGLNLEEELRIGGEKETLINYLNDYTEIINKYFLNNKNKNIYYKLNTKIYNTTTKFFVNQNIDNLIGTSWLLTNELNFSNIPDEAPYDHDYNINVNIILDNITYNFNELTLSRNYESSFYDDNEGIYFYNTNNDNELNYLPHEKIWELIIYSEGILSFYNSCQILIVSGEEEVVTDSILINWLKENGILISSLSSSYNFLVSNNIENAPFIVFQSERSELKDLIIEITLFSCKDNIETELKKKYISFNANNNNKITKISEEIW